MLESRRRMEMMLLWGRQVWLTWGFAVQASPEDRVWGIGFSAEEAPRTPRERWGLNVLGGILEKVRGWVRVGEGEVFLG